MDGEVKQWIAGRVILVVGLIFGALVAATSFAGEAGPASAGSETLLAAHGPDSLAPGETHIKEV